MSRPCGLGSYAAALLLTILFWSWGSPPRAEAQAPGSSDSGGSPQTQASSETHRSPEVDETPAVEASPAFAVDRQALDEIYRAERIAEAPPRPRPWEYFGYLIDLAGEALGDRLEGAFDFLPARAAYWVGRVLLILAIAAVIVLLVAALVKFVLRERNRPKAGAPQAAPQRSTPQPLDQAAWRRRLEDRLEAGDALGALEALWWWLGAGLAARDPDPAWTSGELVRRCGRRDLLPQVRTLDRLRFGPGEASTGQVRSLLGQLEEHLP